MTPRPVRCPTDVDDCSRHFLNPDFTHPGRSVRALKSMAFPRIATKNEVHSGVFSSNRIVMRHSVAHRVARFLAILAIGLQVLLPGTLAVAASNGVDVSRFICASAGTLSAEATAAITELAKLLGDEAPDRQPVDRHCALCTLVHAVPLPVPADMVGPAGLTSVSDYIRYESAGSVRRVPVLPLGSRGPPRHL